MTLQIFLDRYRARMQKYLDTASTALIGDPELGAFMEKLAREYDAVAPEGPPSRPLLPGEEVFVWAMDQLALVADPHGGLHAQDAYSRKMIADLKEMAPRLRDRQPLPPHCQLHFIGHLDDDWPEIEEEAQQAEASKRRTTGALARSMDRAREINAGRAADSADRHSPRSTGRAADD